MPDAALLTAPKAAAGRDDPRLALVKRACAYIDARIEATGDASGPEGRVTLEELGAHCGMSPWHLQRLFKAAMGVTPRQYADARRLRRLRQGLQRGEGVAAAIYDAGFGSSSRVYERADAALGMTPASYAKGGRGAEIAFALNDAPLGRLLVAATPRGICFVGLGDSDRRLEGALRREFPAAEAIRRDDRGLGGAVAALLALIEGDAPHAALPLDVRATAFQQRVWEELRRIPPGETLSYAEIARRLGRPGASRAVGRACATNPVALIVPCHRARRRDGALGGYRWGVRRKAALLAREAQRQSQPTGK